MTYEIAYSIKGNLKEVYFTERREAAKFYYDIIEDNKDNKDFEYVNFTELNLIGHFHNKGKMMRGK